MSFPDFEIQDCGVCGRPGCYRSCVCWECGDGPNAHDPACRAIADVDRFGRQECVSRQSPLARRDP